MSFLEEAQVGPWKARARAEKVNQRDLIAAIVSPGPARKRMPPSSVLKKGARSSLREIRFREGTVTVLVDADPVSRSALGYGSPPNQPMATPAHESFS